MHIAAPFRALQHRSFALLWSGQTASRMGDRFYNLALAWWILEKTGSATAMGIMLVFRSVPALLFLLFGGAIVDRFSRSRIMLFADLLSGIMIASITLLALNDSLEIWHIYLVSVLIGCISAFFRPAYATLVPETVPSDSLPNANSLTSIGEQLAGIIGPSLAALVISSGGTTLAFGLDAMSFFISAICILPLLKLSKTFTLIEPSTSILGDVREGIQVVLGTPWLWISIATFSLWNVMAGGPIGVVFPLLVEEHFHADVKILGLLYSAMSLGAVLAAMTLGSERQIQQRGIKLYLFMILSGMMVSVVGGTNIITLTILASLIYSASITISNLIWFNLLQTQVVHEMLGRVSSLDQFGSDIFTPIGYAFAGWAADRYGSSFVFIVGGIITALSCGIGLLHPKVRNLD